MKRVFMALIRFYRKRISPMKPPCCRFTPTCSAYALEAFEKRGCMAGFILMIWRILRCSPLSPAGYDPVPEKGFRTMPMRWSQYRDADPPRIPIERDAAFDTEDPQENLDAREGSESNHEDESDEP